MKSEIQTFDSVWDALADTPAEAANMRIRAALMRQIAGVIEANGWKQADAAARCGVSQPRLSDLLRGRLSRFSLDALVNIAASLGLHVELECREVDLAAPLLQREAEAETAPYGR